jgi:hypothetical protein
MSNATSAFSLLNLPIIFRCAVDLGEAAASVAPSEWADVPPDTEGPGSPGFERWMERHRRVRRIEEESERLKRSLGATGPLSLTDIMASRGEGAGDGESAKWESYDRRFVDTAHDRIVRLALEKLSTAAIDLSGFATWREPQWVMRERGLRLLIWGLGQLWEGMSAEERSSVQDRLPRTKKAVGWPDDPENGPPPYDGPEEIPLQDQYRLVRRDCYIACYRDYLDDVQKANSIRVEQGQESFLRRATLSQIVQSAGRALQALRGMAERKFDTAEQYGDRYTEASWPLACLRRAREVSPREKWPDDALEQRSLLADAADRLLVCVRGAPEVKASLKAEDAEKALEDFTRATNQLREIANREPVHRAPTGEEPGAPRNQTEHRPCRPQAIERTKPGYPRPQAERLAFAGKQLSEVEQYIAPKSAVLASLLVRALLARGCTTAEAMWAIFDHIESGRYGAASLGELPSTVTYIVGEDNPPAGLDVAGGAVHIGGEAGDWGLLVITLPKRGDENTEAQQGSEADSALPPHGVAEEVANLGQLLRLLEGSERAFAANSRTAERIEAEQGSLVAHWWRCQAAALKFQPDPARMTGIDRIEVLCDELAGGTGLTATSVRQLRARLCRLKRCSLQEADAYSLAGAADALERPLDSQGRAGQAGSGISGESAPVEFHMLAHELLGIDGLPLPRMDGYEGDPYLTDEQYQELCIQVCELVPGQTAREWWDASPGQRIALMRAALAARRARVEPDDLAEAERDAGAATPLRESGGGPLPAGTPPEEPEPAPTPPRPPIQQAAEVQEPPSGSSPEPSARRVKRSTERGEGRGKVIATLIAHHRYANGSCLNLEPIGVNELARRAGVSGSTTSAFFEKEFRGHDQYRALCIRSASQLAAALKLLNGEYSPHHLYGARPPGEGEHDDE